MPANLPHHLPRFSSRNPLLQFATLHKLYNPDIMPFILINSFIAIPWQAVRTGDPTEAIKMTFRSQKPTLPSKTRIFGNFKLRRQLINI